MINFKTIFNKYSTLKSVTEYKNAKTYKIELKNMKSKIFQKGFRNLLIKLIIIKSIILSKAKFIRKICNFIGIKRLGEIINLNLIDIPLNIKKFE